MKTLPNLVLALVVLAFLPGLGAAQQQGVEKSQSTDVKRKQPATGERVADKASPNLVTGKLTGKVTEADPKAKVLTVMAHGRAITFSAATLTRLPKIGEMVDVSFTLKPDELPLATSTVASNPALKPGGYCHCNSHSWVRPPLKSLNVCTC